MNQGRWWNLSEHQLISERERAHQARQLMEHPLWVAAWADFDAQVRQSWERSQPDAAQERESAYTRWRVGKQIRRAIERHIETGRMADLALEERKENE